ncbi:MAG: DUF58 domain-containing protein [Brevinematia bacterium]
MVRYFFLFLLVLAIVILFPLYETILVVVSGILVVLFNKVYSDRVVKGIAVSRFIENTKIFNGDSTTAGIVVENKTVFPLIAYVYDYTSMELSHKQKETFFLFLLPKAKKLLKYRIVGSKRGDHHLGPTMIEFKDLFMRTFLSKEFDTVDFVTVFPSILPHSEIDKSILQPYGEIKNKLPIFEDLTKIQGIREYQDGDEIRKINWKISARHDKLYVNYYNPSVSSGTIVILNLYHQDYDMKYADYYEEFSIEFATTIIFELYGYHQEVGLVANGEIRRKVSLKGKSIVENPLGFFEIPISYGNTHISNMFELLARIYPQNKITLFQTLRNLSIQIPWGTAIVLITPRIDEEISLLLYEISRKGHEIFIYNTHPSRSIETFNIRSMKPFNTLKVENTIQIERVV